MPRTLTIDDSSAGDFEPCPAGVHDAIVWQVLDLGIQSGFYGSKHQIRLGFEVDCKRDDGKNFIVGNTYTYSLHAKATLRAHLEGMRGGPFTDGDAVDLSKVLGVKCQLTIQHKASEDGSRTYANIAAISAANKDQAFTGKLAPGVLCMPDVKAGDQDLISDFWADKMARGWKEMDMMERLAAEDAASAQAAKGKAPAELMDDEIPF